jgi:hypothetical protein
MNFYVYTDWRGGGGFLPYLSREVGLNVGPYSNLT